MPPQRNAASSIASSVSLRAQPVHSLWNIATQRTASSIFCGLEPTSKIRTRSMCHACTILCTDCEHHGSRNRYLILERNPLHKYTSLENACERLPKKRVRKSLPKSGSDFAPRFQNNNDSPVKGIRAQFLTSIFGANSATSFLAPKKIW